jgi:hypothetical protein
MKLARKETKIMVTGRSFYRKNNLKFKNRNLGKMARFRNTVCNTATIGASALSFHAGM